jgi:hypothetical protein
MITTDYFDVCEAAAIALLKGEPSFDWKDADKQVTKSNDTYLDKGFDSFAITYPGAFPQVFDGTDIVTVQWEILIDLLTRWKTNEGQAWTDFKAFRSKVFNLFVLSYEGRLLNRTDGIKVTSFNATDRPRYIPLNRDPNSDVVSHIAQVTTLIVTQTINKES